MTFDELLAIEAKKILEGFITAQGGNIAQASIAAGRNRTDFYKLCRRYGVILKSRPVKYKNRLGRCISYSRHWTGQQAKPRQ